VKILNRDFADQLEVMPAVAGLHVAAVSRAASVDQVSAVALRAAELGVQVQRLARFAVDGPPRAGLLFGYGAITTSRIHEGLSLLRSCFEF
jgi:GntR family transcriptional regulator / MocR family aminotransferase